MEKNLPSLLIRVGLAFVLIFASVEIFINPLSLIDYTPAFIFTFVPQNLFMYSFAAFETALALWLLSEKKLLIPSLITALMLFMIVVFNLDRFSILFRNVAIMFSALALASMNWRKK